MRVCPQWGQCRSCCWTWQARMFQTPQILFLFCFLDLSKVRWPAKDCENKRKERVEEEGGGGDRRRSETPLTLIYPSSALAHKRKLIISQLPKRGPSRCLLLLTAICISSSTPTTSTTTPAVRHPCRRVRRWPAPLSCWRASGLPRTHGLSYSLRLCMDYAGGSN